ncbi:MAG: hypothetical protein ACXVRH_15915 [Thermoleophilaceae bacterium]
MSTQLKQLNVFAVLLHDKADWIPFCSVEPGEADRVREMYALNGWKVETRRFSTGDYLELSEADPSHYAPLSAKAVASFEHELG